MRDNKVTCDSCGTDLTTTGAMPAFRLRLSSEALPHRSSIINAIVVSPPIKQDAHFCNLLCLSNWASRKIKKGGNNDHAT